MVAHLLNHRIPVMKRACAALGPGILLTFILLIYCTFASVMVSIVRADAVELDGLEYQAGLADRGFAAASLALVSALAAGLLHAFARAVLCDAGALPPEAAWRWRGVTREFRRRQLPATAAERESRGVEPSAVAAAAASASAAALPPALRGIKGGRHASRRGYSAAESSEEGGREDLSSADAGEGGEGVAGEGGSGGEGGAGGEEGSGGEEGAGGEEGSGGEGGAPTAGGAPEAPQGDDEAAAADTAPLAAAPPAGLDCTLGDARLEVAVSRSVPEGVFLRPGPHDPRWCRKCARVKAPRAHHCSTCRRCVLKMDHHCPWVGNCVGWGTYKAFLLLLGLGLAATTVVAAVWLPLAAGAWQPLAAVGASPAARDAANARAFAWGALPVPALLGLSISCSLAAALLLFVAMHAWLVATGRTTLEASLIIAGASSPYSYGVRGNFELIFGAQPRQWLWPAPSRDVVLATLAGTDWRRRVGDPAKLPLAVFPGDDEGEELV